MAIYPGFLVIFTSIILLHTVKNLEIPNHANSLIDPSRQFIYISEKIASF